MAFIDPTTLAELNVEVAAALGDTSAAYGTYTSALIDNSLKHNVLVVIGKRPRRDGPDTENSSHQYNQDNLKYLLKQVQDMHHTPLLHNQLENIHQIFV